MEAESDGPGVPVSMPQWLLLSGAYAHDFTASPQGRENARRVLAAEH